MSEAPKSPRAGPKPKSFAALAKATSSLAPGSPGSPGLAGKRSFHVPAIASEGASSAALKSPMARRILSNATLTSGNASPGRKSFVAPKKNASFMSVAQKVTSFSSSPQGLTAARATSRKNWSGALARATSGKVSPAESPGSNPGSPTFRLKNALGAVSALQGGLPPLRREGTGGNAHGAAMAGFFSSPKASQARLGGGAQSPGEEGGISATGMLLAVAQARQMKAGQGAGADSSPEPDSSPKPPGRITSGITSRIAAYRQGLVSAKELRGGESKALEADLRQHIQEQVQDQPDEEDAEEKRRREIRLKAKRMLQAIARAGIFAKQSKIQTSFKQARRQSVHRRPPQLLAIQQEQPKAEALWTIMERGKEGRIALPTAKDLKDLPQNLRKTFTDLAYETMKKFLYPRVLLWRRFTERKRMMEHASATCPPITMDILKKQAMFKSWPQPLLEDLITAVVLMCFEKDEFIIHEGEQAGSGIYFLMAGAVEVLKKKDLKDKRIGGSNAMVLARNLQPVICVGEFSFLTEEPRMASIRATTRCDCLVLKKDDFSRFVKQLPDSVFEQVVEVAFGTRNKNMHLSYPMEEEVLQRCSIFRPCPSAMLRQLLEKLKPYAVPKNMTVAKADNQPADRLLFLRHGKCAVMRRITHQHSRTTEEIFVDTLRAPCVVGDTALLHGAPNSDTIVALSTCDFWLLSKKDFENVLRHHERVVHLMMAEARLQRQGQLSNQQNLFRECVCDIPLLRDAVKRPQLRALVRRFEARVYKPLSVICSMANCADRLIILYKGRIKISDSFRRDLPSKAWHRGECAGFTCVVPHRWSRMAVSREIVECLELPRREYEAFLDANGSLQKVVQWSKVLMFPLAFPQTEAEKVLHLVEHLKTPPLYPQSLSTFVNLSERGFCDYHLSYLAEKTTGSAVKEQEEPIHSATAIVASSPRRQKEPVQQQPAQPLILPSTAPVDRRAEAAAKAQAAALRPQGGRRARGGGGGRWQRVSSFLWLAGAERMRPRKQRRMLPAEAIGDDFQLDTTERLDPRKNELILSLSRVGRDRWRGGGVVTFGSADYADFQDGVLSPTTGGGDFLTGGS
eukprot:Hpha_TRINITY_DN18323_c0_g1::TRINITY_DN18323_c0_g1_i1::g.158169::m.158169